MTIYVEDFSFFFFFKFLFLSFFLSLIKKFLFFVEEDFNHHYCDRGDHSCNHNIGHLVDAIFAEAEKPIDTQTSYGPGNGEFRNISPAAKTINYFSSYKKYSLISSFSSFFEKIFQFFFS